MRPELRDTDFEVGVRVRVLRDDGKSDDGLPIDGGCCTG